MDDKELASAFPHRVKIEPATEVLLGYVKVTYDEAGEMNVSSFCYTHVDRATEWASTYAQHGWSCDRKFIYFESKADAALFAIFWE